MRVGSEMYWAVVAPGATMLRRMWLLGVLLLALGIGAPIALVVWIVVERDELVDLALDDRFLRAITLTLAVALFARLVAVIEVAIVRRHDRNAGLSAIVAYLMVALIALPVGWSVVRAEQAHDLVDDVFVGADDAPPLYVPPGDTVAEVPTAGTVAGEPTPTGTTNILLLGGDSGPGRWGLRTDTMILVSADRASGRTSLVSIPRNLRRLQFPPGSPLDDRFPDGFDNIANAVYPYVLTKPDLQEQYAKDGLQPEAVADLRSGRVLARRAHRRLRARQHAGLPRADRLRRWRHRRSRPRGAAAAGPSGGEARHPVVDRPRTRRDGRNARARVRPVAVRRLRLRTHGTPASTARRARRADLAVGRDRRLLRASPVRCRTRFARPCRRTRSRICSTRSATPRRSPSRSDSCHR